MVGRLVEQQQVRVAGQSPGQRGPRELAADDGQGTYGPADDKVVTNAGFILIGGIPLLLMLLSLLQGGLEKRKYRRLKAAKARKARADQRGGW
jgi:hypothetical protein